MQRRTIWIVVGVVTAALLGMCVASVGIGYLLVRDFQQRQERQVADVFATISAGLEQTPVAEEPTSRATVTPRRSSEQPTQPTSPTFEEPTTRPARPADNPGDQVLPSGSDVAASLVSGSQAALGQREEATHYQISATLDPDQHRITGAQSIQLTNTEDTALNEIYLRLYVNAAHYNEGEISVEDVQVNDAAAQSSLELDDTALKIALPQPLAPNQSAEISMRFTTTVPSSGGGYGIFNEADGVWTLYNWHPELAVYEKEGWLLNPVSAQGDPTNTDASNYEVTFAAPSDMQIITSGVETDAQEQDDNTAHTIVAALARNFVVVASNQFESVSQKVGEVNVTSYYLPGSAEGGQATLDTAAKSIEVFSREFGAYPYTELDVAQVDLGGGAAGMESTGLIMIGSEYYDPEAASPFGNLGGAFEGTEGANILAFTTAHEVAHQWWYGVVGSDAYQQPWLDESLTNWSSAFYVDETLGKEAGLMARDMFISFPYRMTLENGDKRLDQDVESFNDEQYGSVVYGKGALMYDVLRQELGDEKFFEFLRRYYQEQQFDRADSGEWLQTLSQVAGKDMQPFYDKWITGASIQESDLPEGGPLSQILSGNLEGLLRRPNN
ncbi:MAG TPA: M1 family metallopeptidase [Herpetosiphonaceae bacterium]